MGEYFPHPAYKDQARAFYRALGSGKVSIGFNPMTMLKLLGDWKKRIKELDVKSHNLKGEGFVQGGWILFDPDGAPRAAFQENYKKPVPIEDILKEVKLMRSRAGGSPAEEKK